MCLHHPGHRPGDAQAQWLGCENEGSGQAVSPQGGGSDAGLGLQDMDPLSRAHGHGRAWPSSSQSWDRQGMLHALLGTDMASPSPASPCSHVTLQQG